MKSPERRKALSLIIYVALAIVLAYGITKEGRLLLKKGDIAPIDEKITLASGPSTFRRLLKKPMLVNFWATWCPPCRKELPLLAAMANSYEGRIIFVGAAVNSPAEDILALKNSLLISYPLGTVDESVSQKWRAKGLPTTYLLDKEGRVVWAHAGLVHEQELKEALEGVLGASKSATPN